MIRQRGGEKGDKVAFRELVSGSPSPCYSPVQDTFEKTSSSRDTNITTVALTSGLPELWSQLT